MPKPGTLFDQPASYGWISIALHWISAIAVVGLWLLGTSIEFQSPEAMDARRSMHVTVGLIAWLPLAVRVFWRLRSVHPRAKGQSAFIHSFARLTHYLILLALTVMLVTGPLMALTLENPSALDEFAHFCHSTAATLLLCLVGLHVLGALKHLMFNADETVARIFVPPKE